MIAREGCSVKQGKRKEQVLKKDSCNIICAGFGGQGIMVLGKVLALCALKEGFQVTWYPSYGAEVRGGTAHSQVKISRKSIGSPLEKEYDHAVIMNKPSLDKFARHLREGGLGIMNSSLTGEVPSRAGRETVNVPLTEEAIKLGNVRVANMIAASILSEKTGIFAIKTLKEVIKEMARGREELIPLNLKAVDKGLEIVKKGAG